MCLLFVNRNKKAMKTCGNCVDKEMNFAVKPLLFSMKGRKICRIIIMDKGNSRKFKLWFMLNTSMNMSTQQMFLRRLWSSISLAFLLPIAWVQAKLAHLLRSIFLSCPWAFLKIYFWWFRYFSVWISLRSIYSTYHFLLWRISLSSCLTINLDFCDLILLL